MPITITLEPDQAEAVLSGACQRRCSATVRFHRSGGSVEDLPTNLLAVDRGALHVLRPTGADGPIEPASDEQVTITFDDEGRLFQVETVVRGSKTVALDAEASADAIKLALPHRVVEFQRRSDYRVPLWRTMPVTAHFEPMPVGPAEDVPPAEPFHAQVQNIGAGGVAALVEPSVRACLALGQHFLMDFFLPGCDDSFSFAVRVQHVRRVAHNDARLIGFKFVPSDNGESTRQVIRQIRSFVQVSRRLKD